MGSIGYAESLERADLLRHLGSRDEAALPYEAAHSPDRERGRAHIPAAQIQGVPSADMSTHTLRDLRNSLGTVVREVAYSGHEAIITDNGREVAVIIGLDDYERLHEHADIADALHLRNLRSTDYTTMSLTEMLGELGVSIEDFTEQAG